MVVIPGSRRERTQTWGILVLLHGDSGPHPGMDAALKVVFAFGEPRGVEMAALQYSRPGDGNLSEAAITLWDGRLSWSVQPGNESSAELCHFGEGVRLTALVHRAKDRSLFDG